MITSHSNVPHLCDSAMNHSSPSSIGRPTTNSTSHYTFHYIVLNNNYRLMNIVRKVELSGLTRPFIHQNNRGTLFITLLWFCSNESICQRCYHTVSGIINQTSYEMSNALSLYFSDSQLNEPFSHNDRLVQRRCKIHRK